MLYLELALAVVGDGRLDYVCLAVVGDAVAGVARDLAQRVGVLAGLVVGDLAHRDLAVGGVSAGGDDLSVLALDELEGELAFLEIAPGQDLGRLNLVGDAGILGRHVIGVLKDRLLSVLQLVLNVEGAIVVILDDGHDGVLSGAVSNAVFGGAGLGLAQRVGVLASRGIGDGIHHDLAVGIVGAGGDYVIALDELKAELAGNEADLAAGQDLGRGDLAGDAGVTGVRLVAVAELRLVSVLQDMLDLERAVAVVGDGGLDGVGLAVVSDAAGVALDLAQRIGVRSGLGVLDGAHRDLAIGGVLAGGNDLGVLALALDELEGELALSHVAPGQDLGRLDLVGDARLNRRHVIGVGERKCHIAIRLAGHPQITLAVISHGEGNRTRRLDVVGHASDLAGLCHGVGKGVLALLGLLAQSLVEVVERKGNLAKVDLALGIIGHARVRGHGCALFTGHGKGELTGNVSRGQAIRNLQILLAHKRCLDRRGSVGVHKLVAGIAVDSRRRQGTIAVVGNGHICVNCRRGSAHARRQLAGLLGSNVMNSPRGLICAGVKRRLVFLDKLDKRLGRVRQRTELNLATLVGCVQQDLVVPRIAQRKLEFTVGHQAPRERLGSLKSQRGFRLGAIGVRELSLTRGLFNVGLKLALGVNRHSHLERGNVLAVGNATGVALDLADLIGVLARLVVGDLAEINGSLAIVVQVGIGHGRGRGCGHRGIILGRR